MQHTHPSNTALEQPWPVAEHETFRALFEEAPIAYHELDSEGIVRRVNQAQCELLGYRAEEMVGKPIWTFMLSDEQNASRENIARNLAGAEAQISGRRTFVTRDLRLVTVEVHGRLIRDTNGTPVGIRAALIDITERVAAEARLMETQQWLVTTLNSLSEAVLAVDSLGTVKFMNGTAQELLEWPAAEAAGRDVGELLGGSEIHQAGSDRRCTVSDILDTSLFELLEGSMLLKGRNGKETAVEITSAPHPARPRPGRGCGYYPAPSAKRVGLYVAQGPNPPAEDPKMPPCGRVVPNDGRILGYPEW